MAGSLFVHVCLLTSLTSLVMAQTPEEEVPSMMMRRQKTHNSQMHLGPGGELRYREEPHDDEPEGLVKMQNKQKGPEVSYCDQVWAQGPKDSNDCEKAGDLKIIREEDCMFAAEASGLKVAPEHNFTINDVWENPDPYAKDCFLFEGLVYFNPTDTNRTDNKFKGTPICSRMIYVNGTLSKDSDEGCPDGYKSIDTWKECEWAHDCRWGAAFCQEPEFANDHYTTNDAPRGCYQGVIGCYGFNANTVKVTGNITGQKPVCKLADYEFKGRPDEADGKKAGGDEAKPLGTDEGDKAAKLF